MTEILQNDIFGKKHSTVLQKEKKQTPSAPKNFPNVTIIDGNDEIKAANDAMLIHRILQKKLLYAGNLDKKQREIFMKILKNEMEIKAGKIDSVTATRDSLLAFFVKI